MWSQEKILIVLPTFLVGQAKPFCSNCLATPQPLKSPATITGPGSAAASARMAAA